MRYNPFPIAVLLIVSGVSAQDKLIDKPDPAVQAQIEKVFNAFKPGIDPRNDTDVCREVVALRTSTENDKLVKQVAVFAATKKSGEDTHVIVAQSILQLLDLPPRTTIRVLAPYLDADNRQIRDIARMWFDAHDMAGSRPPGSPPIKPVNYEDYLEYIEWQITHNDDIPPAFIKYIYGRAPGRALLVFAYANSHGDVTARLKAMRANIEGTQPETKEQQEQIETGRKLQSKESREARLRVRREIELSEHIVSDAIWLQKNKFDDRFQAALPDAKEQLDKLAKGEWWAKLYVVYIMRQNPPLLRDKLLRDLAEDENELVSKAAKSNGN